jgi:hypothetical protein
MKKTTTEMTKAVTLDLSPLTLIVQGKDKKELLENAKKAFIEQLAKKFPAITYSINDADALTIDIIQIGQIVECEKGKGIVKGKTKNRVSVTLSNSHSFSADPGYFKRCSATFEEVRSRRPDFMKDIWFEGQSAYLKTRDKIVEVIVGKMNKNVKLYVVGGNGVHYSVPEEQLNRLLKDELHEVK